MAAVQGEIGRWAVVLLTASFLASAPADADPAPHAALTPSDLVGRWKLDWERSTSMAPFLEAIEVSWPMNRLSGLASIELRIAAHDDALVQIVEHPIGREERTLRLDGVARRERGMLGRSEKARHRWTPQGLITVSEMTLPSGSIAELRSDLSLTDDGRLLSVCRVEVRGRTPVVARRVFHRMDDAQGGWARAGRGISDSD